MDEKKKDDKDAEERDMLRELDEKMREFAVEREKLNKMSSERIAMGKPLTDGEILRQNEICGNMSMDIMELQEYLDEIEDS